MQQKSSAWRGCAVVLFLSLAQPVLATAQVPAAQQAAGTSTLSAIRIDNFGQINPNYYRGAQPKGGDYADLARLGVRTVVDLTKGGDPEEAGMVQRAGMKFFRIPMTTREAPSGETVASFLQIVNDPSNQPVYVHCQGGRHRTGAMTAVYRMTDEGWTADQAFAEMKRYRFGSDFLHPELKRFVYGFRPAVSAADASRAAGANTAAATKANRQ